MDTKRLIQIGLILILLLVSFATYNHAQASSACGSTYVVQPGDWLAKIARRCGITLTQLYSANDWARYYHYIYPGQLLTIPGGYDNTPGPGSYYCGASAYSYVVCRGDTLGGIAMYYGVTIAYLQSLNGIPNANLIYPGQFLRIY